MKRCNIRFKVWYDDQGLGFRGWVADFYRNGAHIDNLVLGMPVRRDARKTAMRVARRQARILREMMCE